MNWWMLAGGTMALLCAVGHAVAGLSMFYRPIKSAIKDELQTGVMTGMWHLITIHFTLSAVALLILGAYGGQEAMAWFIAVQFAGYATAYLAISLALGRGFETLSVDTLCCHCNSGGRRCPKCALTRAE